MGLKAKVQSVRLLVRRTRSGSVKQIQLEFYALPLELYRFERQILDRMLVDGQRVTASRLAGLKQLVAQLRAAEDAFLQELERDKKCDAVLLKDYFEEVEHCLDLIRELEFADSVAVEKKRDETAPGYGYSSMLREYFQKTAPERVLFDRYCRERDPTQSLKQFISEVLLHPARFSVETQTAVVHILELYASQPGELELVESYVLRTGVGSSGSRWRAEEINDSVLNWFLQSTRDEAPKNIKQISELAIAIYTGNTKPKVVDKDVLGSAERWLRERCIFQLVVED